VLDAYPCIPLELIPRIMRAGTLYQHLMAPAK
jgi:hypothetical protein